MAAPKMKAEWVDCENQAIVLDQLYVIQSSCLPDVMSI